MAAGYKYVVLGGGNAAGYAAAEFVKRGVGKGEVAILSREPYVSYERPTLSKAYLFPEGAPRLPGFHTCVGGGGNKQEPNWYKENGIDFKTNTEVTKVDVKGKSLTTDGGENISFEKLIFATGSRAVDLAKDFKSPGADLEGIYTFRDVVDADAILKAIPDVKARGGKAVVIGGGYIGMEVGSNLSKHGLEVTLVYPEKHLMDRLFTPEIASFYEEVYKSKGIKLQTESVAESFEGKDGKVTHAVLKDGKGKLEAQLVIAGVGARPNTELLQGQIDLLEDKPGGVKVNGKLQTSDPDVYAIGDIAAYPLSRYGITTRQEHVKNARQTAAHAVSHIFDPSTPDFNYLPFFYSRVFDLGWQLYGSNAPGDETVFFGDKSKKKFGTYFVRDGKVVGAFLEGGSDEENKSLEKLAQEQPKAPSNLSDLASQGISFASKL